jgi:BirA family transcriptional regulator, biotin operon repressor / biotin---[acetyl-CoA-carboxylase] ligase
VSSAAAERRQEVLAALVRAGGDGVSGEEVAGALGCSRAAVHRHVEALRSEGHAIDGLHGGYRLAPDADPVVPSLVAPALRPPIAGPVEWRAVTGSTNDDVLRRAREGAPEGLVIGADLQQEGRGRRGRPWEAASGDAVLMSVLLRPGVPPVEAGLLPIVAAVGVSRALGPRARIVWPNDILVDGTKVAGILCEMSADQEHVDWAVVGIGLNVRGAPALGDARWRAGSLAKAGDTRRRPQLVIDMLGALGDAYRAWSEGDASSVLGEFSRRDALVGHGVTVSIGDQRVEGTCEGLDDLGRLRVRGPVGERALGAGEVTRVEGIGPPGGG